MAASKKVYGTVAICAILAISAYFGFAGANYGPLRQSAPATYERWITTRSDDTKIRQMALPGTHNTIALYSIGDLAGQCQTLSLRDQLGIGVRFLDIRLKLNGERLRGVHGSVDQRVNFTSIVEEVDDFLTKNPGEFLFVSIKDEVGSEGTKFQQALEKELTAKWSKKTTLPSTVGEARGRAWIISRFPNSTIGFPAYQGWGDSASFVLPGDIYVQDTYKTTVDQKKEEIARCFAESGHTLKINFLSGYQPGGFPPSYAPSIASTINPWVDANISSYADKGIVLYDFVDSASMKAFFGGK